MRSAALRHQRIVVGIARNGFTRVRARELRADPKLTGDCQARPRVRRDPSPLRVFPDPGSVLTVDGGLLGRAAERAD
jgi:hypothetical protein